MPREPDHVWVAAETGRFALHYVDGAAHLDDVDLRRIAQEVGTPTYVYGANHIEARYRELAAAVAGVPTSICYAVKANASQAILRLLARLGAGADIVSGGELQRVLAAGIAPAKVVFSGVGKTDDEIDAAIMAGVRSINVESSGELARVDMRARSLGRIAPVCLRVNPDVDPDTHPYLATGLRESKFGIAMGDALALAVKAHESPSLELVGLACHIGSQIAEAKPYLDSLARIRTIMDALRERGIRLRQLDLGGGIGIAYARDDARIDVASWGRAVTEATRDLGLEIVLEPGRWLVGNAGVLLTRVVGVKSGEDRNFVIVDAAMNDLLRPALYGSYHAIVPTRLPAPDTPVEIADIVGPVCECGDFLAQERALSAVAPGDLLAVLSAGAYGMTMASTYNTRPLAAEVLVAGDAFAITRPRKSVADLIAEERIPAWLE
jgi:diaminopimelate decarboxylase